MHWQIHPTHTMCDACTAMCACDATIHIRQITMCDVDTHKRYDATYDTCVHGHTLPYCMMHMHTHMLRHDHHAMMMACAFLWCAYVHVYLWLAIDISVRKAISDGFG